LPPSYAIDGFDVGHVTIHTCFEHKADQSCAQAGSWFS
jgi:hypothetical protein